MAKRLTDTGKWKDTWFQDLPNKYKLFWIYLLDECDAAGLWKPNMRLASFQVGEPFEEAEVRRVFSGRIILTKDDYWFIPKFVSFQYGELSHNSKPHQSIIKMLERSKLIGYVSTLKEKEKEEEKEKESSGEKEVSSDENLTWPSWAGEKTKSAWEEFKAYKKSQHKFSYKSIVSEQKAINELSKLFTNGKDCVDALEKAMARGWMFPVVEKKESEPEKKDEPFIVGQKRKIHA